MTERICLPWLLVLASLAEPITGRAQQISSSADHELRSVSSLSPEALPDTQGSVERELQPRASDPASRPKLSLPPWLALGAEATTITMVAPSFRDPYQGENSFRNEGSARPATTLTMTLFTAASLWRNAFVSVQPEFAGGNGPGGGTGIAGYPNFDVVRIPSLNARPYIARAFIQQDIPLGNPPPATTGNQTPSPGIERSESAAESGSDEIPESKFSPGVGHRFGLAPDVRRLEITFGKIAALDVFDLNDFSGDPHHQLMNWALPVNGAWDYAADTRGYTWGLTVALEGGRFNARFGEYTMPSVANGPRFDSHYGNAHSENLELEWQVDPDHQGVVRVLGYLNHARMGNYDEAIATAGSQVPDITATREPGRKKVGAGLNLQRSLGTGWGIFSRVGWNDGRTETFAFTEIDRTASLGVSRKGLPLGRQGDQLIAALTLNGLSGPHRRYLEAGGLGFQIGDGDLNYGYETIIELNYTAKMTRGLAVSVDYQHVTSPGYNRDRGPISIYGLRVHVHL
jgi:high affinity Mn2+ porin